MNQQQLVQSLYTQIVENVVDKMQMEFIRLLEHSLVAKETFGFKELSTVGKAQDANSAVLTEANMKEKLSWNRMPMHSSTQKISK